MAKKTERGKAYYMISAVSQKYNIHPQTLRLYEREGLLKPSRTEGNTRLYSEEDLEQLETILSLTRDLGVNLAGVEIILNMRRKIERMQGEVNEFMDYVKRELARGIDDWEQRLSTAMVKSAPTDLVRRTPPPSRSASESARSRQPSPTRPRRMRRKAQDQGSGECWRRPLVTAFRHDAPLNFSFQCYDRAVLPALRRHRMENDRGGRCAACHALRLRARARPEIGCVADARIPQRYQHCTFANYARYNEQLITALRVCAALRRAFPVVDKGAVPEGPPGVGKTHLAVAVLLQVIRTRGARGLFYDTRDLLRVIRVHLRSREPRPPRWTCSGRDAG